MKRASFVWAVILAALMLVGCPAGPVREKEQVLARVNDYELTVGEFEELLAEEIEMTPDYKLTREGRQRFLDQLVRKELLIQEAQRLQIDRRERFVKGIERFWEQTLIRDLLDMKNQELKRRTSITQEEIAGRYEALKAQRGEATPPLEELAPRLERELRDERMRQALDRWLEGLRGNGKIFIDNDLLQRSQGG
jgi:hypothetical protein